MYIYLIIVGLQEGSLDVSDCYLQAFHFANHT